MSDSKHQKAREIHEKIREVLMQHWDPIGVSHVPEAADEYDSYIGSVYRLLTTHTTDTELIDYLHKTETHTMGLTRSGTRDHLKTVVAQLRKIDVKL